MDAFDAIATQVHDAIKPGSHLVFRLIDPKFSFREAVKLQCAADFREPLIEAYAAAEVSRLAKKNGVVQVMPAPKKFKTVVQGKSITFSVIVEFSDEAK